jgi:hypothetical protein
MESASHPSAAQLLAIQQDPVSCSAEERAAIEAHVAECRQCRSQLAVLRNFDSDQLTRAAPAVARTRTSLWDVLLRGLSRPAFAISLSVGLLVAGVLAIPWFGGEPASAPQITPVAGVEEPAPEPAPEATGEEPEPPIPPLPEEEPDPQTAQEETPGPEAEPAPPESPEPSEPPAAEQPVKIAALVPEDAPIYHPDAALAGGSLESRRSAPAGVASGLPEVRALGPEHVGATSSASPTLYWFLSGPSRVPVEIRLAAEDAAEPLLELRLEPPVGAGLHNLRLDRRGIRLEPGVTYRWFVALIPDPANRDADLVSGAAVRMAPAGSLAGPPAGLAHALAAAGYWYDAFDTLTAWIQKDPSSERLREHRAALLEQVGLSGVAGLLSAPGDSSKPAADQ